MFGDGETPGLYGQSIQAIALVGAATVYVIDEFIPQEFMP